MFVELHVEHLLGSREVERIEAGGADKSSRDGVCPDIVESHETHGGLGFNGPGHDLLAMVERGENDSVEVNVEVQAVRSGLAIGGRGDSGVDQPVHRHLELVGNPQEQGYLVF